MKKANAITHIFFYFLFCPVFLSAITFNADAGKNVPSIEVRLSVVESEVSSMQNNIYALKNTVIDLQNQINNMQLAILSLEQGKVGFSDNALGMVVPTITDVPKDIMSVTINAPSDGYVILFGSGFFEYTHVYGVETGILISLRDIPNGSINSSAYTAVGEASSHPSGFYHVPFALTTRFNVSAGQHTFYMNGQVQGGTAGWAGMSLPNLTALFVPIKY